uniref:Galectin n=1 Tax=Sinocyclocheilus rhinocerous TaxID=307959 RepID=A0A673JHD4_9TELE
MYNIWAGYSASCFHIRGAPALVLNTQLKICIFDCRKTRIGRMAASEQQLAIYKPVKLFFILHVNLQCGSDSDADIALHINPRYENDSAHVMYSTYKNGTWGSEQSTPDSPFVKDKLFAIEILVTKEVYKVYALFAEVKSYANGKHVMDYEHRIPITQVHTISVDQNIELEFIGYQKSLLVPYKTLINGGLQPGNNILIYGVPNTDSKRVEFNLRHRYGIAFHYLSLFDENVVVCNTSENGKWGAEERSGGVPFLKGQLFQVGIYSHPTATDRFSLGKTVIIHLK